MPVNAIILSAIVLLFLAGLGTALLFADSQAKPSRLKAGYPKPRRRAF
jgi:hypothetical protein